MPALDVAIASRALLLLGEASISSFDGTQAAQTAGALYPSTRDAVLTCYPWFATKATAQLARLAEAPAAQWSYQFQLPSGFLRVLGAWASSAPGAPRLTDYDLGETKLLANQPDVYLEYQRRLDEAAWPPYLRKLMEYALAAELAMPITEQIGRAEYWQRQAWGNPAEGLKGGWYRIATTADAQGAPAAALSAFALTDVRA